MSPMVSERMPPHVPVALTIAGSDSGGGAGIQADLRTFSFHQVHGTSALTCVTAQNTTGVTRVDALPADAVVAQIDAVTDDFDVAATKIGMLLNQSIISAVADRLTTEPVKNLVLDPVMVSRSGDTLIDSGAVEALTNDVLPLADVVTPNIFEARILTSMSIDSLDDMKRAADSILRLGAKSVLIKGGSMSGELKAVDVWSDGKSIEVLRTKLVTTSNTHGTGCTLSAAIAANLANGMTMQSAVETAKVYVTEALNNSLSLGHGQGPVGHFYQLDSIDPSDQGAS